MLQFHDEYMKALKQTKGESYSLWEAAERFFLRQPKQTPSLLKAVSETIFGKSELEFHESKGQSQKVELTQAEVQFLRDLMKDQISVYSLNISYGKAQKNRYWLLSDKNNPETTWYFDCFSHYRSLLKKDQSRLRTLEGIQRKLRKMLSQ